METMTVHWQKCNDYLFLDCWCRLDSDLLNDPRLEIRLGGDYYGRSITIGVPGVYIIWARIDNRTILKVGSGVIRDRFRAHLRDPKVQAYKHRGLYATWAPILFLEKPVEKQRGIERFLGWILKPKLTLRLPEDVDPIFVNTPVWEKPANPFLSDRNQLGQIPVKGGNPFRLGNQQRRLAEYLNGNPFRSRSQQGSLAEYLKRNK